MPGASKKWGRTRPWPASKETVTGIEAECHDLGLPPFTQKGNELQGQVRLGYTARAKELTDELGNQGAYSIYSGAAHAELARIWRLLGETGATLPGREPIYGPVAKPEASFAAADMVLKSMMGPIERTALSFGWTVPGRGDGISATIAHINSELKRLHP